ncbi:hypothetical protein CLG96_14645 [Sphingomonas oleivorans]|uniref:Stage II sporulation protein M n=2 Tax=Sphingomonas oleivorans TaxID=1735121 RepID=A0A2T5FVH6_9SPHN|nr:stage II sporulation protein M [Sphingomonas oleivorans]PTQ09446.1 hypothetical protein CLG96_14645 [Sphingomonas oleivorans]
MRSFREAHEADWRRLEDIVARAERKSVRSLADEDLFALPLLYRSALSSLSVARDTSLDKALVDYLESLCTRAYMFVYGVRTSPGSRLARFFRRDWPAAIRAIAMETIIVALMMIAGAVAGYLLVRHDPSWFYEIIPAGLADGRDPGASTASLEAALQDDGSANGDALGAFAAFLFTHNAQIAILAFALGFAFGIPTLLLIAYNGIMLGAFLALYVPRGLGPMVGGWLAIHGTTELFAIILAGAAGLRIGRSVMFPGGATRMAAAVRAGQTAATAMAGVVLMLMVAGLLEGIGRQTITTMPVRYLIGAAALAGWCVYYYLVGRGAND